MPKMVDHDRVVQMAIVGCPAPTIAHRLRISLKTVRRILKQRGVIAPTRSVVGTPDEWKLWTSMKRLGGTDSQIAYSFGYSRQYINQFFKAQA